jgi:hypothetical protein
MGRELREPRRAKLGTARVASLIPRSGTQKHSLPCKHENAPDWVEGDVILLGFER